MYHLLRPLTYPTKTLSQRLSLYFLNKNIRQLHGSLIMESEKIRIADRHKGSDKNVWVEFGRLAVEHKAVNLGQGFPDHFPPQYVRDALSDVSNSDSELLYQYTRSYGHPRLVNVLSVLYSRLIQRDIHPMDEILITVGAYGALYCAVQGLINPGDEVIIIEPYFDCYEPMVRAAGGIPVFIPLEPTKSGAVVSSADWKLDPEELTRKFSDKTKAIFLNTPNNPLGKVYRYEELELIANLCKKHDVVVFADEVYEWLIYNPNEHIRIATLPDMWQRTITIGSAGKSFSVTGWKTGWAIGPSRLIYALQKLHQNCIYTCPTPIQEAVAIAFEKEMPQLEKPECYFNQLPLELIEKRDRMVRFLREAGMIPTIPEGGYFMLADYSKLKVDIDYKPDEPRDLQFVRWLTKNKKLAVIPPSAFYSQQHKHLAEDMIRLCFIKARRALATKFYKKKKRAIRLVDDVN
ncbi:hypothetical protein LSH36_307g03010 [Paralvinella palmiformis]|uniref:Aminotransferase class I/classII large domain-containing protein n=1 Tax=Paralvinella palmiformis TaxID=53620 RepID=A0AAD9JH80_9ANNE|nr:hypothetical protein LSH36_307g03010 [Paralvinella palmiformis]